MPYPFKENRPRVRDEDAPDRLDNMVEYLFRLDANVAAENAQQVIDDLLHIAAGNETAAGDVLAGERA